MPPRSSPPPSAKPRRRPAPAMPINWFWLIFVFLAVVLILARRQFVRPTSLLEQSMSPRWLLAVAAVIAIAVALLFFAYSGMQYTHALWWEFAFDARAPRALRAVTGAAVVDL